MSEKTSKKGGEVTRLNSAQTEIIKEINWEAYNADMSIESAMRKRAKVMLHDRIKRCDGWSTVRYHGKTFKVNWIIERVKEAKV